MISFEFHSVSRIVFGRGQFEKLGALAAEFGRAALVVTHAGASGERLWSRADPLLAAAGLRVAPYLVHGEPDTGTVDAGVEAARSARCDVLVAVGGGSALDAAKAIAGLLTNGGVALDYMEVVGQGRKITRPAAPWIAAPTTGGTGAEVTRNAVIGCPDQHFKASIRSEHLLARVALVDPQLGVAVRPEVTARCGLDALTQCLEAYTSRNAQPITDALALDGLRRAGRSLRRACEDGADLDAREDLALAALFSGLALANAGLGAVHGCAAPLGARVLVPHGTACAALLPPVVAANVAALRRSAPASPVLARYAEAGRALTGHAHLADAQAVDQALEFLRDLVRDLKIPGLRTFGLTEPHLAELAGLARKASSMKYNPVELSEATLSEILRQTL